MERWLVVPGFLLMFSIPSHAEVTRSEMLAIPCFACHGVEGVAHGEIPSLDNDNADEIQEKMNDFKDEDPRVTIMTRIARGYTAAEIRMLAEYFGGNR